MARKPMTDHDDDAPELDAAFFARARPAREVISPAAQANFKPLGRPKSTNPKQVVNLRLDPKVLDHFKAGGPGWQTRINDVLLEVVEHRKA